MQYFENLIQVRIVNTPVDFKLKTCRSFNWLDKETVKENDITTKKKYIHNTHIEASKYVYISLWKKSSSCVQIPMTKHLN